MHELSVAQGIVDVARQAAERAEAPATVRTVRVRVGALSGVVPDALLFCFDVVTRDTPLDGAALEIERVPVAVWCPECSRTEELAEAPPFRCPVCDTPTADVRRGRELEVLWVELDDGRPDGEEAADAPPVPSSSRAQPAPLA